MNEFACPAYRHALIRPWLKGRLRRHKNVLLIPLNIGQGGSRIRGSLRCGTAARYANRGASFRSAAGTEWSGEEEEEEAGLTV